MIPVVISVAVVMTGIPRESGDDPQSAVGFMVSWLVFPARAGMIRIVLKLVPASEPYSPRERG